MALLTSMGYARVDVLETLQLTGGDVDAAANQLIDSKTYDEHEANARRMQLASRRKAEYEALYEEEQRRQQANEEARRRDEEARRIRAENARYEADEARRRHEADEARRRQGYQGYHARDLVPRGSPPRQAARPGRLEEPDGYARLPRGAEELRLHPTQSVDTLMQSLRCSKHVAVDAVRAAIKTGGDINEAAALVYEPEELELIRAYSEPPRPKHECASCGRRFRSTYGFQRHRDHWRSTGECVYGQQGRAPNLVETIGQAVAAPFVGVVGTVGSAWGQATNAIGHAGSTIGNGFAEGFGIGRQLSDQFAPVVPDGTRRAEPREQTWTRVGHGWQ